MFTRGYTFACLLLFAGSFSPVCSLEDPPLDSLAQATVRINRSLFPIVCGQVAQPGNRFSAVSIAGTGMFVDSRGHFITASHVIRERFSRSQQQPNGCFPAIYIPRNGWETGTRSFDANWFKFRDCVSDQAMDVAVCQTVGNPFALSSSLQISFVQFAEVSPESGTPVAFTGFPMQAREPVTTPSRIVRLETTGNVTSWVIRGEGNDEPPWPGSSGSPVYLADGKVIGIILRRGIEENSGLAFALSASAIRSFLTNHQLVNSGGAGKRQHAAPSE
ncbi:MAG TPA: serine protease [Candidatus Angelobacter sp.]|nr:serine protease [Candidatus Angelobacter sp.]